MENASLLLKMRAEKKRREFQGYLEQIIAQTLARNEVHVEENWLLNYARKRTLSYFGHVPLVARTTAEDSARCNNTTLQTQRKVTFRAGERTGEYTFHLLPTAIQVLTIK